MNQEILAKAIEKAVANGWSADDGYTPSNFVDILLADPNYSGWTIESVIYDHDFAKALWGIGCSDCGNPDAMTNPMGCGQPEWKLRLSQMVVAEDPILYLGDHL